MTVVTLKGNPVHTIGKLPDLDAEAPEFSLVTTDLSEVSLKDYKGKKVIMNIFPSLDTSVCAKSVQNFNDAVQKLENTIVLAISRDLPFAQERFCTENNLHYITPLSDYRYNTFGDNYGVTIIEGPMTGLLARAVIVLDEKGTVVYKEMVEEISNEPKYKLALKAAEYA